MERSELEVEEQLPKQHCMWKVQRAGWTLVAITLLASIFGLLSPGIFSKKVAFESGDGGFAVKFERALHYQSPCELEVFAPEDPQESGTWISINRSYLDRIELERMEPEATESEMVDDRIVFHFRQMIGTTGKITVQFKPTAVGNLACELRTKDTSPIRFKQFVFP